MLGIDFGSRSIGLAVGEKEFGIASPRPSLAASGTLKQDAEALIRFAKREEVQLLALGLPLLPTGEETKASSIVRRLAAELERLGATVALIDEAYSTDEAHTNLIAAERSAAERKKLVDSEAACVILQRYFSRDA